MQVVAKQTALAESWTFAQSWCKKRQLNRVPDCTMQSRFLICACLNSLVSANVGSRAYARVWNLNSDVRLRMHKTVFFRLMQFR